MIQCASARSKKRGEGKSFYASHQFRLFILNLSTEQRTRKTRTYSYQEEILLPHPSTQPSHSHRSVSNDRQGSDLRLEFELRYLPVLPTSRQPDRAFLPPSFSLIVVQDLSSATRGKLFLFIASEEYLFHWTRQGRPVHIEQ